MREFVIDKGKYSGKYKIYDNENEYYQYNERKCKHWLEDNPEEFEVGEYVVVNDGVVLPILNITKVKTKEKKFKGYLIKFPNGMASIYKRIDGTYYRSKFYGNFTNVDTFSFSRKTPNQRITTRKHNKQLFANLIASGTPITQAAKLAFPKVFKYSSFPTIKSKIINILNDEEVIDMIKDNYNQFIEKLNSDPELSDEMLIEYIKEFIRNVRKGSQTHLNSIIPLLKLLNKIDPEFKVNSTKKIEEIDYTEIPPEQLPPITENN